MGNDSWSLWGEGVFYSLDIRMCFCAFYLANTVPLPPGKVYGCCFLNTWPTLLQGMISRLPLHCHTRNEISANTQTHTQVNNTFNTFHQEQQDSSCSLLILHNFPTEFRQQQRGDTAAITSLCSIFIVFGCFHSTFTLIITTLTL